LKSVGQAGRMPRLGAGDGASGNGLGRREGPLRQKGTNWWTSFFTGPAPPSPDANRGRWDRRGREIAILKGREELEGLMLSRPGRETMAAGA